MTAARADNSRQRHQASETTGQTQAAATTQDHRSENKYGRPMTSGDASIVPLSLASSVVGCQLLSAGCRVFAACSPPGARLAQSSVTVPRRSCGTVVDSGNEQKELAVRTRRLGWLAWSLWGLTMVLEVTAIWLWLGNRSLEGGYFAPQVFLVPGFATVGAVIVARRANRVGWRFLGLGFVAALHAFSMAYAERDTLIDPASLPAGFLVGPLAGWLWPLNYMLFFLILLLFPDGRLPSPRWRSAVRCILVAWGLSILLSVLTPSEAHQEPNPLGVSALQRPAGQLLLLVVNATVPVGLVISAAAPFLRFRRAGYQQRQQLKWVAFTVAVSVLSVLVSLGLDQLFPRVPVIGLLGLLGFLGVVVGIPLGVAVAILRHRLYDIDRIINRTLVYALLTALLAGIYAGVVLLLGQLFGGIGETVPSWAVAAATLAVAALFQPARRRIQQLVDRRFNRRKYNAAKTVEAFSTRLRDQVDLDTLSTELLAVVDQTMEPTRVSLWLRPSRNGSSSTARRKAGPTTWAY
jgi:hypothetical protein